MRFGKLFQIRPAGTRFLRPTITNPLRVVVFGNPGHRPSGEAGLIINHGLVWAISVDTFDEPGIAPFLFVPGKKILTGELLPRESNVERPFPIISFDNLVCTDIPHHYRPATILAFGNGALESKVFERVILGRVGKSAHA